MTRPIYSVIPASAVFEGAWEDYGLVMRYCRLDHTDLIMLSLAVWEDLQRYTDDEALEQLRDIYLNKVLVTWRGRSDPSFTDVSTVSYALERLTAAFQRSIESVVDLILQRVNLADVKEIRPVTYLSGRHLLVELKGNPVNETLLPVDPVREFAQRLAAVINTL